jgi:hypothetical protein
MQWVDESASGGNEDELDKQRKRLQPFKPYLSFFTSSTSAFVATWKKELWVVVGGDWIYSSLEYHHHHHCHAIGALTCVLFRSRTNPLPPKRPVLMPVLAFPCR